MLEATMTRDQLIADLVERTPLNESQVTARVDLCRVYGMSTADSRELIVWCMHQGWPVSTVLGLLIKYTPPPIKAYGVINDA